MRARSVFALLSSFAVVLALSACDSSSDDATDAGDGVADAAADHTHDAATTHHDHDAATTPTLDGATANHDASATADDDSGAAELDAGHDAAQAQDAGPTTAQVKLVFEHTVNGVPVTLGTTTPYTNAAGNTFGVTKIRYFISKVKLELEGGAEVSLSEAHYLDIETASTLEYTLPEEVPVGDVASISFVMGLPPDLNTTGAFTALPESAMEWPVMMGGGYHYMQLEGNYDNTESGAPYGFKLHTGGLSGTDYSFSVVLDADGRSVSASGTTFTVRMNIEKWMASPNQWDLNDHFYPITTTHATAKPGMMNNATEQQQIKENGANVFTLVTP